MNILTLLGPVLVKAALWAYDRIMTHWKSSTTGVMIGGAAAEALQLFGCDPTLLNPAIVGAIIAAPKLFGTDADKIAPTIWQAVKESVEQQKRSNQVLSESEAAQEKAAKDAGLK